jgi:hypothetical protein
MSSASVRAVGELCKQRRLSEHHIQVTYSGSMRCYVQPPLGWLLAIASRRLRYPLEQRS